MLLLDNNSLCILDRDNQYGASFINLDNLIFIDGRDKPDEIAVLRREFSKIRDFSGKPGLLAFKIMSLSTALETTSAILSD